MNRITRSWTGGLTALLLLAMLASCQTNTVPQDSDTIVDTKVTESATESERVTEDTDTSDDLPEPKRDAEGYLTYDGKPNQPNTEALDFSYLNEMPAGQHGAVLSKDGDFVFEDGTPVKFFGVNLGFGAAFPDKAVSDTIAADLAALGVNMVRIHAVDSSFYGSFIDYTKNDTQQFNAARLDKLDYLIHALKEKGIYIHFDMVGIRTFKEGDGFTGEKLDAVKALPGGVRFLRGHLFSDATIARLVKEFTVKVLEHKNPYTGMTYAEDPVIAVIQYANESSITWVMLDQMNDVFCRELEAGFSVWLKEKYKTTDALREAWRAVDAVTSELGANETLEAGNVKLPGRGFWSELKTSLSDSKPENCRYADYMAYLMSIEKASFTAMYEAARAVGYKGRINCSNYPEGVVDLWFNTLGDVAEKNAYWDDGNGTYHRDVFMTDADLYTNPYPHMVAELMNGVSADMPFIVTEFNNVPPHEFKADTLFQMASYGALQGWDGLIVFCYTFESYSATQYLTSTGFSDYGIDNDPSYSGAMGMASAIFRKGLVSEAVNTVENVFTEQDLLAGNEYYNRIGGAMAFVSKFTNRFITDTYEGDADLVINSGNLANGDYSAAKHAFLHAENSYTDAMLKNKDGEAWLRAYDEEGALTYRKGLLSLNIGKQFITDNTIGKGTVFKDPRAINTVMQNFGLLENGRGLFEDRAVSDTGELIYDMGRKSFLVNTDRIGVFAGRLVDGVKPSVSSFSLDIANDVAAVAVYSQTEAAIEESESLLIYAIGRTKNSAMQWNGDTLVNLGVGPVKYQDVAGTLYLTSEKSDCRVWALDAVGKRVGKVPVSKTEQGFAITLGGYMHYEVVLSGSRASASPVELKLISLPETLSYKLCQPFDLTGLRAEAVYADGTKEDASFFTVSGFDCQTKGTQTVTVTYKGASAAFTVTVT